MKIWFTIWNDIRSACHKVGATLCGGHTEITIGLSRPIVCGQMLGEAPKANIIRGEGAREGDAILLTRAVPVEGTAIMAEMKGDELAGSLGWALLSVLEAIWTPLASAWSSRHWLPPAMCIPCTIPPRAGSPPVFTNWLK
jgi:hydrogenase maturation factor